MIEQKKDNSLAMYFRTSVVIFADAAGMAVYKQLCDNNLFMHMHEPLHSGIGLIYLADDKDTYYYQLVNAQQEQPTDVISALQFLWKNIDSTKARGERYIVEDTTPQLYIVAQANTETTRLLVNKIRQSEYWFVNISCIFCCEPFDEEKEIKLPPSWQYELFSWAQQQQITSCYFYGDVAGNIYKRNGKAMFDYIAAEALFALLATGIAAHKYLHLLLTTTHKCVFGTLSTCLIMAPRPTIRDACVAWVTALFVAGWLNEARKIAGSQKDVLAVKAKTSIEEAIHPGYIDNVLSLPEHHTIPAANMFLPNITVLKAQKASPQYGQAAENFAKETTTLFQRIAFDRAMPHGQWTKIMDERFEETRGTLYTAWQKNLADTWSKNRAFACDKLVEQIIQMQKEQRDIGWSIAIADEIDQQLQTIHSTLEKQHIAAQQKIELIAQKSEHEQQEPVLSAQARRETLYQQVNEQYALMPSRRLFILMGFITVLACVLPLAMLVTTLFGPQILYLLIVLLGSIAVVSIIYYCYFSRYTSRLMSKQRAVIDLYYYECLRLCENAAYKEKLHFIETLRERIRYMTSAYLTDLQKSLEKDALDIFERLFASEKGKRDFFGGNDLYLKDASMARNAFFPTMPVDMSHSSFNPSRVEKIYRNIATDKQDTLFEHSQEFLYGLFKNPERTSVPLQKTLKDAIGDVIQQQYMSSTDFTVNLKDVDLWGGLFQRLKHFPLSRLQKDWTPIIFLCASKEDLNNAKDGMSAALSDELVEVRVATSSSLLRQDNNISSWILVAALYNQPLVASSYDSTTDDTTKPEND